MVSIFRFYLNENGWICDGIKYLILLAHTPYIAQIYIKILIKFYNLFLLSLFTAVFNDYYVKRRFWLNNVLKNGIPLLNQSALNADCV